ncbi:hypothetical protein [Castellaniella sp.]|uniref:hypothetical protein n=1 Tax=Castellaniella sp. TaxID=1955812 RepID=UPI002AFF7F9B|nr:hypothetical protein [Castellaniella sp.]
MMKDIDEIRRSNMAMLEDQVGGATAAAKIYGCSQSQWSNWRLGAKDSKTGKRKGMRKESARSIEKAFGKPAGWLDIDRDVKDLVEPSPVTQEQRVILDLVDRLTTTQRRDLLRNLEQQIQANEELLAELEAVKRQGKLPG